MLAVVIVVAVVALAGLAVAFAVVVLGIQLAERRQGLPGPARGCADAFARRVLGARVCQAAPRRSCQAARSQRRRVTGHAR